MEGNYTVTFMTNKDYIGSATFYLKADGSIYKAVYSYNTVNGETMTLNAISKVDFVSSTNVIAFEVGDVDLGGTVDVIDIIILQKYLLNAKTITLSQWHMADLNNDGTVDVFDLGLLKRQLFMKR